VCLKLWQLKHEAATKTSLVGTGLVQNDFLAALGANKCFVLTARKLRILHFLWRFKYLILVS